MDRPVKAGEVFATFIFDGIDCADMGVYSITNGGTYTMLIEPNFNDDVLSVPAYDGRYYYGTQYNLQQFQFEMFADDLSLAEYRNLRTWLAPRKIGKLILSDQPYKYYLVKVASISTLGNYPRVDPYVINNSVLSENGMENVIYTGRFTVSFETVGSIYGYGLSYYRDDLIYDALNHYGVGVYPENYYYDSGLLYKDMAPSLDITLPANAKDYPATWYNPGTAPALPEIELELEGSLPKGSYIRINNNSLNSTTIIDLSEMRGKIKIDTESETIADDAGHHYYGRFSGNPLEVGAEKDVLYIPESFVENIENTYFNDYDSFFIVERGDSLYAEINPLVCKVKKNMEGKFFCTNGNGGVKILEADLLENRLLLSKDKITYTTANLDSEGNIVPPTGFACNYTGAVNNESELPASGALGDVKSIITKQTKDGIYYQMYIYRYSKWSKTNLFTTPDNFKNIEGNYITKYLMFGANIVGLDDITIDTNFGESAMKVSLLPRYL